MATIKDVARAANVAVSTASLALRNHPSVKEATRRKVVEAAKLLKYRPNGIARDLKTRKTETLCMLLHDLGGPFYSELIRGVQAVANDHGYDVIVTGAGNTRTSSVRRMLFEHRFDGAIILSPAIADDMIVDGASEDLPIVVLDRDLQTDHVYRVRADNEQGGFTATQHLIDLGHRKIVFLGGPTDSFDNLLRYKGHLRALRESGLEGKQSLYSGNFTEESGYSAGVIMCAHRTLPDAIFSANDEMAIGVMRALQENGVVIPDDIAVVGFDDIQLSEYVTPSLTTVRQPMYKMGLVAANILFQAIQGTDVPESLTLTTELVIRNSTRRRAGH